MELVKAIHVDNVLNASPGEEDRKGDVAISPQLIEAAAAGEAMVEMGESPGYPGDFISEDDMSIGRARRASMSESKIMSILQAYINNYPQYLNAKQDRQITEFHDFIGRSVASSGNIVSGLLKNLGREYRKVWHQSHGAIPETGLKLRGSVSLHQRFEDYYKLYNKISLKSTKSYGSSGASLLSYGSNGAGNNVTRKQSTPRIKKMKPSRPFPDTSFLEQVASTSSQVKIPPISVLSDEYCQEYIEVVREQNRVLSDIAKELRLMRMGYFTEHELSMDP